MKNDNNIAEQDFLNILWKYFELHANQRTVLMNFYIILESFFLSALFTIYQIRNLNIIFKIILCIAIIFFSFIFYSLDMRTKKMIRYSEECLKKIENKYKKAHGNAYMIFNKEEALTTKERKSKILLIRLSYSQSFLLIYLFFTSLGILMLIITVMDWRVLL